MWGVLSLSVVLSGSGGRSSSDGSSSEGWLPGWKVDDAELGSVSSSSPKSSSGEEIAVGTRAVVVFSRFGILDFIEFVVFSYFYLDIVLVAFLHKYNYLLLR